MNTTGERQTDLPFTTTLKKPNKIPHLSSLSSIPPAPVSHQSPTVQWLLKYLRSMTAHHKLTFLCPHSSQDPKPVNFTDEMTTTAKTLRPPKLLSWPLNLGTLPAIALRRNFQPPDRQGSRSSSIVKRNQSDRQTREIHDTFDHQKPRPVNLATRSHLTS